MITTLPPYPAYKDSGVPWLGKVPVHWEVMPVKRALRPQSCGTAAIKNTAAATPLDGYAPAFSASGQDVWLPRASHCGSALVLSAVGARCGKTFRADGEWGVVANTHILWPRTGQNRDFWWYVTNNEAWWDKAGAAQPFVRVSATLERSWVIPPLPEQTAIVRFLDYVERRIRRFIRAKQKLIKLLEEYRQALIHQAVTGKIDVRTGKPYPSCKDSGVPWLVKVPEHWEVVPLRWFISIASGDFIETSAVSGNRSNERPYPVIGGNGVLGYAGLYNATEITVVVGRVGALCGNVHIVNEPAWITDNALMITQIIEFSPKFLSIQLKVMDLNRLANANAQPLVTGGMIKAQRVVKPLIHEQLAIVDFVDEQTAKLDAAIAAARREIELLREYRERLIADVVTGKVDVRGVAAQLPEEPPDQEAGTEEEEPVADELATVDSQEEANGEE
jgi:type I restriction enzyme S subunit